MSQNTHGGALAPFLIGLGCCAAVWAAAGSSCAGTRSAPLSQVAERHAEQQRRIELQAQVDQGELSEPAPEDGALPELDPQVASKLNLLQEAMETSAVGLDGASPQGSVAADTEPEIDWSAPAMPLQNAPVQEKPAPAVMTMGETTAPAPSNEATPTTAIADASPVDIPLDPALRVETLASELAQATTDLARRKGEPVQALLRLAALETVMPGVSDTVFADGTISASVAPDELHLLQTWRDAMRTMGTSRSADAGLLISTSDELAGATAQWRDLTIQNPALCTRVDGYGVYEPLSTRDGRYTFVAGRANRVIVYLELDHFHTTAMRMDGRDGYAVELSQSLALYHAGTPKVDAERDLIAWQRPEVRIDDFSRRARRDFFVVQMIELPSTISVGSYRLKVRVTDQASGAEAESVIDVDFVADAALASHGR